MIVASDESVLLLDPDRRNLVRRYTDIEVLAGQAELRRRWMHHIASPRFDVDSDQGLLTEEYVVGRHIRQLAPHDRLEVVRKVFASYTSLTQQEARRDTDHADFLVDALTASDVGHSLPVGVAAALREHRDTIRSWPVVPSGSDNSPDNVVIVGHRDPLFIDVFPMQFRLFFAHPCAITMSWDLGSTRTRDQFLSGGFDEEIQQLFEGADRAIELDLTTRQMLLALSLPLAEGFPSSPTARDDVVTRRAAWLLSAYGLDSPSDWYPPSTVPSATSW